MDTPATDVPDVGMTALDMAAMDDPDMDDSDMDDSDMDPPSIDIPAPHHSSEAFDQNGQTIWQAEPNEEIIKAIAEEVLHCRDVTVKYLDQGVYNQVFDVTVPNTSKEYLFRVTNNNIHPRLKTDSEVATLKFLRRYTKIPVAEVKAWQSSLNENDNELGFEWILMEKIPGVPLKEVWRTMSLADKKKLVERIAEFTIELRKFPFPKIGSIYTTSRSQPRFSRRCLSSFRSMYHRLFNKIDSRKCILGPMVDQLSLDDKRSPLPEGSRGPFESSQEWMRARGLMQQGFCEYYKIPHGANERLLQVIPYVCKQSVDECTNVLYHHDLTYRNIIVDQETFKVNGIIDWEMTCVVPIWKARTYPKFIMLPQPSSAIKPYIPSLDVYQRVDGGGSVQEEIDLVQENDRWDARSLRRAFDIALNAALTQDGKEDLKPHLIRRMRELECATGLLKFWSNIAVRETIRKWRDEELRAKNINIANVINNTNDVAMEISP